jgi:hypothetical protein
MGSRVVSDEGFSVKWGRDALLYKEHERTMTVTIDWGGNGITLFSGSVTRWDDDPSTLIDKDAQGAIVNNIFRALTFYQERHHGEVRLLE